jgi:hypothetical protein
MCMMMLVVRQDQWHSALPGPSAGFDSRRREIGSLAGKAAALFMDNATPTDRLRNTARSR